jgi:hypothetical protein
MSASTMLTLSLEHDGFAVVEDVTDLEDIAVIHQAIENCLRRDDVRTRELGERGGAPEIIEIARPCLLAKEISRSRFFRNAKAFSEKYFEHEVAIKLLAIPRWAARAGSFSHLSGCLPAVLRCRRFVPALPSGMPMQVVVPSVSLAAVLQGTALTVLVETPTGATLSKPGPVSISGKAVGCQAGNAPGAGTDVPGSPLGASGRANATEAKTTNATAIRSLAVRMKASTQCHCGIVASIAPVRGRHAVFLLDFARGPAFSSAPKRWSRQEGEISECN